MKKIIIIGMLMLSALTFAAKNVNQGLASKNKTKVDARVAKLSDEQKLELKEVREKHLLVVKEMGLNIKEVNLKIEKELLEERPNKMAINNLIDEKSKYRVAAEKKKMEYRLEVKEKFGFDTTKKNFNRHKDHSKKPSSRKVN